MLSLVENTIFNGLQLKSKYVSNSSVDDFVYSILTLLN